jgi:5-formyltetrahydrofolate cyclo-ligase
MPGNFRTIARRKSSKPKNRFGFSSAFCFDRKGFRVGYGKGFYDKFSENLPCGLFEIGLSYFEPVAEITDAQEFDVRLDFCVTPEKIVDCK